MNQNINNLSQRLKISYLYELLKRDGGFFCFYCKDDLSKTEYVYEHLDDNRGHNEIENIVLACISCNNKKPSSLEMKKLALEKKEQNKQSNLSSECIGECARKPTVTTRLRIETPAPSFKPELDRSDINFNFAEQFLSERLSVDEEIEFKTAVDSHNYDFKKRDWNW